MREFLSTITKKQLFAIVGAVVAVGLVAYAMWSVWLWGSYNSAVSDRTASAKQATIQAVEASEANASANVKGLRAVSDELNGIESICEPTWPIAWQTIAPSLNEKIDSCEANAQKYKQVKTDIDTVVAFLDSEQAVLGILSPLKNTKELSSSNWENTIASWQTAASDLEQLQTSAEYEPVLGVLQTQLENAVKAWQQLEKSDKNKKRTDYENAYDSLDQAITGIIDAADKSDTELKKLLVKLNVTVQEL